MTPRFPEQRVFNKLHHASARSTGFIQELEIYGRVSEEGFEAAHPMIESMMKNTKSMISVDGRRRVSEISKTHHPEMKTRGPWNKHYRTRSQNYTAIESTIYLYAPAGYFRTKFGHLLKFEWKDVHEMRDFQL